LGSTTTCFFCWLHSFVHKHILHIIVLRTIYDLMSSVTTNMIGIFHKPLYFNLLNSNLKNYKNMVFKKKIYKFEHYDLFCDNLYNTFLFFSGLSKVSKLILSYYFVVLTNCLWLLFQKFLFHKPIFFPYAIVEFLSSYLLLLHTNMVVI